MNSELGDGICQHNTQGCNFDDGDCDAFRLFFPDCTADKPYLVGNGMCDEVYNTIECRNDGGDCIFTDATSGLFLNGEFISIEDYKADTKTYAIIQSLSSVISLVASLGIVFILYRSYNQMSVPFHRLLLGLSVADICSSFAQAWSTLLSPDPLDVIWNAHGSKGLCQAQGFLIFVGSIGAPLYNCSLCIYYLLAVKRKGIPSTDFLKKKEVLLHLVPIGLSLVGGLIIFCMDAFHPNMTYCFIGDNPVCDEEADCEKRLLYARILFVVFSAGPYIVLPCVIIGTMTLMYRDLLALEKRLEQLLDVEGSTLRNRASNQREDGVPSGVDMNVSPTVVEGEVDVVMDKPSPPSSMLGKIGALMKSKTKGNETETNDEQKKKSNLTKQSRAIMYRAVSYSVAFFLTYFFPIIISIRTLFGLESGYTLSILARIFFPLQGFFNFVVFLYPKVVYEKTKRRDGKISWFTALTFALKSRIDVGTRF